MSIDVDRFAGFSNSLMFLSSFEWLKRASVKFLKAVSPFRVISRFSAARDASVLSATASSRLAAAARYRLLALSAPLNRNNKLKCFIYFSFFR
jgi:hypothetical protein